MRAGTPVDKNKDNIKKNKNKERKHKPTKIVKRELNALRELMATSLIAYVEA